MVHKLVLKYLQLLLDSWRLVAVLTVVTGKVDKGYGFVDMYM